MQQNWQHSIHNREETPPPGAWDTIVHRLDENGAAEKWVSGIYLQEEMPPEDVWQNIAAALDRQNSSSWQTALYNREAAPPPGVWAAVSAALDAAQAPAVPLQPARKKTFIYYSAAAAVITAVAATALWIWDSSRNTAAPDIPANSYTVTEPQTAPAAKDEKTTATALPPAGTQEKQPRAAISQQQTATAKNSPATIPGMPAAYAQHTPAAFLPDEPRVFSSRKLPDESGEVTTDINLMEAPAGSYVTISGPDGQNIRVSSKFAGLVTYLNPDGTVREERLDVIIRESARWKATFRQWREKMQQNTSAPSIGNFMDVLEMSKALSENR